MKITSGEQPTIFLKRIKHIKSLDGTASSSAAYFKRCGAARQFNRYVVTNNMRILYTAIIILCLSTGCNSEIEPLNGARVKKPPVHEDPRCVEADKNRNCLSYSLSIYELLANSEKYHNKVISLGGYLKFEFEGNAIYATKEHYLNKLIKDAIWIDVNGLAIGRHKEFREGYAYIRGKYDRFDGGHFRLFSGALKEIDWFQPVDNKK